MAKSKIIRDLANGEVDTITALKRAKVLVSDLNNDEISEWLDYEISGYPTEAIIPSYRKVHGSLMGSYFKGSMASAAPASAPAHGGTRRRPPFSLP